MAHIDWPKVQKIAAKLKWFERPETSRCGVYMLRLRGVTQYIGKAVDVDGRLAQHRREGRINFDAVLFAAVPREHLDGVERELLLAYEPPRNGVFPAKDHGPILNRQLRAARVAQRQQQPTPQPAS